MSLQPAEPRYWQATLRSALYCGEGHAMFAVPFAAADPGTGLRPDLWTCRSEGCSYQGKSFRVSWPVIYLEEIKP